ncbi:GNAT family N-acetyltransferase [Christiangramia echinicola]|uniref:N-acetylglutamate synthase, GNAT family n=1 Tax=Christiangramia echinicola TaxID=279359 RepID=A0A1H1QQ95_9FLAO|nr:GNAT family N-acetyltransferase [Christiangramia echinicola]SDS25493.1 N-acetylglutamate synthase, GNAT family [Christiangramia echinicola]
MIIREAKEDDLSSILRVLKASLGETSSKKTENVWKYKHIDNPFGKSLILLAEEDNEIIGVRAFMRWQWQKGSKIFHAVRAVDTATHPKHQGKGVFRKLTLKALELAEERGEYFVFNTPNSQSKPGYLKMGWREVDKLKIQLRPLNPFMINSSTFDYGVAGNISRSQELIKFYSVSQRATGKFFTPKSLKYLIWRYVDNPLQQYMVFFDKNYFIAGYVKQRGKISELRISELIVSTGARKQAKSVIISMIKTSGAHILSLASNDEISFKTSIMGGFGPMLTIKDISLPSEDKQEIFDLSRWNYSIGDLELF